PARRGALSVRLWRPTGLIGVYDHRIADDRSPAGALRDWLLRIEASGARACSVLPTLECDHALPQHFKIMQEAGDRARGPALILGVGVAAPGRIAAMAILAERVAVDLFPILPAAVEWLPAELAVADRAPLLFGEAHPVRDQPRIRRQPLLHLVGTLIQSAADH